jgi:hypothetical protein
MAVPAELALPPLVTRGNRVRARDEYVLDGRERFEDKDMLLATSQDGS